MLILHDTTEFIYHWEDVAAVGMLGDSMAGRDDRGRVRHRTGCGIAMHSSLAVILQDLLLGLRAIKFWTGDKFHDCNVLKKKVNPTRVPIEKKESIRWLENLRQSTALTNDPQRCIHIGDRDRSVPSH